MASPIGTPRWYQHNSRRRPVGSEGDEMALHRRHVVCNKDAPIGGCQREDLRLRCGIGNFSLRRPPIYRLARACGYPCRLPDASRRPPESEFSSGSPL